ncbi:precorrin-2 C(20)-methyltransferase [Fusibacter sp. JL298sf-3]
MTKFYGIGVGPGDPELLTIKAVNTLEKLDILLIPSGKKDGKSESYEIAKRYLKSTVHIEKRHFPMTLDLDAMHAGIAPIAEEVKAWVLAGKNVGFLTLGDPMLYSTFIYLLMHLKESVPVETLAGITSFGAIASGMNTPLVDGDASLVICPCTQPMATIEKTLLENDAVVLMKLYKNAEEVVTFLEKHDLSRYCIAVSNFGKPNEIVHKDLRAMCDDQLSYFTTLLMNKRWYKND